MSLLYKACEGKGFVAVWKIEETSDQLLNSFCVTDEDRLRVIGFRLENRKQEFLAARRLIKEILNIDPIISYLPSGKPVLENSDFNLSISHTKGYAAIVLSKDMQTGIDIERCSERVLKVSSRFITSEEEGFVKEDQRLLYYTLLWCLKETMYKVYDQSNIIFNKDIYAKEFKIGEDSSIQGVFNKDNEESLNYSYKIFEQFILVYRC